MIGQTISHYKILEQLGEGGMGVVYKAVDLNLDRNVAIKILHPQACCDDDSEKRFLHEAKLASSFDHPNIGAIYEIDRTPDDQTFIVMAYYEGKTLMERIREGGLAINEATGIAVQIADGLAKAHERGIIHRDVKSSNVILTPDGRVKILDFGLAKLVGEATITKEGTLMGTVSFMSPEQLSGEEVDRRSDIWSLGVIMYEMIAGRRPFIGLYDETVIYLILNKDPQPLSSVRPDAPQELEDIILKALAKRSDERYQSIDELISDLKNIGSPKKFGTLAMKPTKAMPSIAVLPFTNMSNDPAQEYFCDGMAEEIINALVTVDGLRVVARTSAFSFKNTTDDIRQIGKKLDVNSVLEGSVRKAGNRLRITVQLINVADGYHIWSNRYDREMTDVFAIQEEIACAVCDKLKVKLMGVPEEGLVKRSTENLDAYNLYLKGRFYLNRRSKETLEKGKECFQQAIAEDSQYALAYTGLADAYNLFGWYNIFPPQESYPKAREAAAKALELDDSLSEAHTSMGYFLLLYEWNWEYSEKEFKKALELNPESATAHHWYSEFLLSMGRFDESINEASWALEYDPLSLILNVLIGLPYYFSGQIDRSIEKYHAALEMDPSYVPALFFLGLAYARNQMVDDAVRVFEKAITVYGPSTLFQAVQGCAYAWAGNRPEAEKKIDVLQAVSNETHVPTYYIAAIHALIGDHDLALDILYDAYNKKDHWLTFLKIDPLWENVRQDPRFIVLLKKMDLAE